MKNLFLWRVLFQMKKMLTFWIFNESNIWEKGLSYLKKWGIGVSDCWNYGPSKLLLHFIEYRLDQLKSKHTKIAVNSAIQYFKGCCQKKCLLKVWRFLVHPTQHGGPVKFFAKLNVNHLLMANIFKFHEYHTFGLMKNKNFGKQNFENCPM